MAEEKAKVINKSGTLKMDDKVAATKVQRDMGGRRMDRRGGNRRNRNKADVAPKEFDEITINIDRVSRTVKGGRRMRFKALVAIGDHKNRVGVGVAKGGDVTAAVAKATAVAKRNLITINLDGETICHEVETKVTGANVLMKPAAPGTGIIAGGVVRSIVGLTGIKNLISKSLGSTNKVNIAYAVIEGLKMQVPRSQWIVSSAKAGIASQLASSDGEPRKDGRETERPAVTKKQATSKKTAASDKPAAKPAAKKPATKKAPAKKEDK